MTEREQLELAAKAAGLAIEWVPEHDCYWIALGQGIEARPWDPRGDDGDAFRLQVAAGIGLKFDGFRFSCQIPGTDMAIEGRISPQAVREAVFSAAVHMGQSIKGQAPQ